MYRLIFSNWKAALLWAVCLCLSVAGFFSRGGEQQFAAEAERIASGRKHVDRPAQHVPEDEVSDEELGWGSPDYR